jgi:uncharacterized protein (TIGR03083 family)
VINPPELSDVQVEGLLGAYALDACDPDEVVAIEAVLARRPDLAAEARRLIEVAAWLGAAHSLRAPDRLRADVLAAVTARRATTTDAAVELYEQESEQFAVTLSELPRRALRAVTANGLTARDLVTHVAAQESLLAQLVGDPVIDAVTETDIVARTDAMLTEFADRSLDEVLASWREAVDANRRWALTGRDDVTVWRGIELSRDDALVVRAFETWVHGEDLRRVAELTPRIPPERHLAVMADLAGRSLGLSLALAARQRPGRIARLVLTGAGGGSWTVAMGGEPITDTLDADAVDVTLVADTVDWCRLVGDRIAPDAMHVEIDGDASLAEDLLAAASALATL